MTWWERLGWHRGEMQVYVGCAAALVVAALLIAGALLL